MNVDAAATDQIKSDRSTKMILVTGATGDTGRPTVKLLLERGHKLKALVHKDDERAKALRDQGADVVVGDMLDISSMRKAADGVSSAYFVRRNGRSNCNLCSGRKRATARNDCKYVA